LNIYHIKNCILDDTTPGATCEAWFFLRTISGLCDKWRELKRNTDLIFSIPKFKILRHDNGFTTSATLRKSDFCLFPKKRFLYLPFILKLLQFLLFAKEKTNSVRQPEILIPYGVLLDNDIFKIKAIFFI
jgi:hypothetical protein